MHEASPTPVTAPAANGRSPVGSAALLLTVVSAIALGLMVLLDVLDVEGFSSDDESSAAADATWLCFSAGAVLALVLGVVAWVRGRRDGRGGDVQAGKIAAGYFLLAVIATAIAAAVTS